MGNVDFFDTVENKLQVTISQRIKSHLKFHNMDNFKVASLLTEQDVIEMENFARNTLHQVLQPEEMVEFYGFHFQKKPELFVFTLGERMHFSGIKQVCQEICDVDQDHLEENDTNSDFPTSKKFTNAEQNADDSETPIDMNKNQEKGEFMHLGDIKQVFEEVCQKSGNLKMNTKCTVVHTSIEKPATVSEIDGGCTRNLNVKIQKRIARRRASTRKNSVSEERVQDPIPESNLTNICLRNLPEGTSSREIRNLVKPFGPIQKMFLGRNHDSGLCNGFASIDFKLPCNAARAIETLNGKTHKTNVLIAKLWKPRNKKTVSSK